LDSIRPLSVDLIADLDKAFPMPTATELLSLDDRQLGYALGKRAVVEFLHMRQRQEKEDDYVHRQ
jgi:hypothetical protein